MIDLAQKRADSAQAKVSTRGRIAREEGRREIIMHMSRRGINEQAIHEMTGIDLDEIKQALLQDALN